MSKVILFSRVSTLGQDLEQQNNELYAEAKRNGFTESDIILIENKESAIKLDEEERKGIQELKDIINEQDIDCVIIYEISRLARRPTVLYSVRDFLIENGVNLICMKPYMKLLDPDGKMSQTASILFSLFGAMSESEMMIKKERMIRGRIAKREQCKFIGGNILFGYKIDDTEHIIIDKDDAKTVIEIFERYVQNESIRSIAKDLLDRGRLKYDDYSTACVMLRRMIRRSEYAGIKGNTYDYPPIISQQLYNNVRARAESKNKYKTRLSEIYFLQGLIHWKYNDMLMSPVKGSVQYRGWDEKSNSGIMINMDYIDSLVWHFIKIYKERASGPEKANMMKSIFESWQKNIQREQNAIRERQNIEATIERINERVVKGKMSDRQGDRMIEEQKERLRELDRLMKKYTEDNRHYETEMKNLNESNINDYTDITDEKKQEIYKQCIKKVNVDLDKKSIHGKYIDIYMVDGTKHSIHMNKHWNWFNTYNVVNGEEHEIKIDIIKRFERKNTRK